MPSITSLYSALSGLTAARAGLDTTADNVANASTPGRTRRRVDLTSRPDNTSPFGKIGAGVSIGDITRSRDAFLDTRVRSGTSASGRFEARADVLRRLEDIMAEPHDGPGGALDELWATFEEWSLDPPDQGQRTAVISALEEVAGRLRQVAEGWMEDATTNAESRMAARRNPTTAAASTSTVITWG